MEPMEKVYFLLESIFIFFVLIIHYALIDIYTPSEIHGCLFKRRKFIPRARRASGIISSSE